MHKVYHIDLLFLVHNESLNSLPMPFIPYNNLQGVPDKLNNFFNDWTYYGHVGGNNWREVVTSKATSQ